MDLDNLLAQPDGVGSACTLASQDRPLRLKEFDGLLAEDAVTVTRPEPGRLRVGLRPDAGAAARAAALAVAESRCCSFFVFDLTMAGGDVTLTVTTPPRHEAVLRALGDRAEQILQQARR